MKILKLIQYLKTLWIAETPRFWFDLQRIMLALSVSAGVGLAQIQNLPKWTWLPESLKVCMFLGLLGTFLAQFTNKTPPPSNPTT
jgi:hypothetical protein